MILPFPAAGCFYVLIHTAAVTVWQDLRSEGKFERGTHLAKEAS